jgi:hypothetical protein
VFHYVSILETLRNLLSKTAILHYIMSETEGRQQTHTSLKRYSSYPDGKIYANHTLFSKHRICLKLHIYTDEFEVVNLLVSKKGKHKQDSFLLYNWEFASQQGLTHNCVIFIFACWPNIHY